MSVFVLFNGLWQGALIVGAAYLVARLIPERNAATRYALWLTTLLALAAIPIVTTVLRAGPGTHELLGAHSAFARATITLIPAGGPERYADALFVRFLPWITALWLLGVAFNLGRLFASFGRMEAIRRNARPVRGDAADVFTSDEVAVPLVAGILAPRILIPALLANTLPASDLERIVVHERAHIRRKDPVLNLFQRVVEACLFFNPWVHLAARNLSNEREAACDDRVVEEIGRHHEYAACLAALAEAHRQCIPVLTPSAFGSRSSLLARIKRLQSTQPRRLTINRGALGGIIVLFAALAFALQTLAPALAMTPSSGVTVFSPPSTSLVAASCALPNAEASVVMAAEPMRPHGLKLRGIADAVVTIAPSGHVSNVRVLHSSGNAAIDAAVVTAARHSTYRPKVTNCAPVEGSYIFHVEFKP